jgi:hypothetical protein
MSGRREKQKRRERNTGLREADALDAKIEREVRGIAARENLRLRDARRVYWFAGAATRRGADVEGS